MLKNKKAFTLVELLIVLAVFASVTVTAGAIFVTSTKADRKVAEIQRVQGDARYSFEAMVREIRGSKIDYAYYADPDNNPATNDAVDLSNPLIQLALLKFDGSKVRFRQEQGSACLTSPCLTVNSVSTGGTWVALTPAGIAVRKLVFVISPATDPFIISGPFKQPTVTLQLATETVSAKAEEVGRATYQTTVVSRQYGR